MVTRLGSFEKLWQALHCASRRLHYAWSWENARLCCTLRPVSSQNRIHLEIERVADFPEIELRILTIPKSTPLLAQVVFPTGMTITQAKNFIYRELEEVVVQGGGRGAWLAEEGDGLLFHVGAFPPGELVCLELEKGLHEWVAPATAHTCRFEFAGAAGWSRAQVDQWLQRYLHVRDHGRTMDLQVPYRMMAGLAGPISEILFGGPHIPLPNTIPQGSLEFIAVPPLRKDTKADGKRKPAPGVNGLPALPREGAGLEQDLAVQHRLLQVAHRTGRHLLDDLGHRRGRGCGRGWRRGRRVDGLRRRRRPDIPL